MPKYHQGYYIPKNPEKYVGDVSNIYYRSGWERKFMKWADTNPAVLKWNNEEMVVPYISPVDMKPHRYFLDFLIMVQTRSGEIKKFAVEIKPLAQTMPPKAPKRQTPRYLTEMATYAVNQAKWEAAESFCKTKGLEFIVLTEKELF